MLRSSIWLESDSTRILFFTMLMAADRDGFVEASEGGLAHMANISREKCREGLNVLESPDADSRTPDHEGRRIERLPRGWRVLNHALYREMRTEKQVEDADRQARHRAKVVPSSVPRDMSRDISQSAEYRVQRTETTTARSVGEQPTTPTALESLCNRLPIAATDAVNDLAERSRRPKSWAVAVGAMLDGLGAPRGIPVSPDKLAQALIELAASDYATTPATVRAFLTRADRDRDAAASSAPDGVATTMLDLIKREEKNEQSNSPDR